MSDENVLTEEIAEEFLAKSESVDLSEFTAIEDEAAKSLSEHEGSLSLNGLTELSDAVAESLSKHKGDLWLGPEPNSGPGKGGRQGITELSDAAAESLSKHEEYININLGYLIVNPWTPHGASSSAARILEAAGHGEWPADEGFYYEDVR